MQSNHQIYFLIDQNEQKVKYIGQSNNAQKRLREHIKGARGNSHTHCSNWIRRLLEMNQLPTFVVIENNLSKESANEREIYWIAEGRRRGWPLTNITDGGDGWPAGKKMPPFSNEHRRKISEALKGKCHTNERRKKNSDVHVGKYASDETRKKMSESRSGKKRGPHSEETKNKLKEAWKRRKARASS